MKTQPQDQQPNRRYEENGLRGDETNCKYKMVLIAAVITIWASCIHKLQSLS